MANVRTIRQLDVFVDDGFMCVFDMFSRDEGKKLFSPGAEK